MLKCEATLQANCSETFSMLSESELYTAQMQRKERNGDELKIIVERERLPDISPPVHDRRKWKRIFRSLEQSFIEFK